MCRLIIGFVTATILIVVTFAGEGFAGKLAFWDSPRRGANVFNAAVGPDLIRAAKEYSIDFIRLAPDKFPSLARDFLIGNADGYAGLIEADFARLKSVLDTCARYEMPVVLVMLSLPGSRWRQNNGDRDDLRLWLDDDFVRQSAQFWKDLAIRLRDHPAVVGYDILNEPHLERLSRSQWEALPGGDIAERLHVFDSTVVSSIRTVDSLTPIIIESSAYASPEKFAELIPVDDPRVLYSFHMYEPYDYTNKKINDGRFSYPGPIGAELPDSSIYWNSLRMSDSFGPVREFQARFDLPPARILAGEFGGNRQCTGMAHYLDDLIEIFEEAGWHWAVYSFREDTWDGMDYELGDKPLPWKYWQDIEAGIEPTKSYLPENPIFRILRAGWRR